MNEKEIRIVHLYSHDMNVYGDRGNILCLEKRLEWYGHKPVIIHYNQGDKFPDDADIIIGGGGQDSGQNKIYENLLSIGPKIKKRADKNVPMLVICGMYQLFGNYFKTNDGKIIKGIGLFDIKTYGKSERLIGNILTYSEQFGEIIGYENHSGQTYLEKNIKPFGKVILGAGNNATDSNEGARYKNVIGSYLHGSLLPKNPKVADFLIKQAVINKYGEFSPIKEIDDSIAISAREIAKKRPR
ncbi:MAG TPA: glutamine amidotransferase [Candidatus Saccharibacteria bacterium]|nr:glutamine amidotransferase [Candidatus Saccharibacteria bacterium]